MFEDFKEKVGKLQNKINKESPLISTALSPEITEKLRKAGIDPTTLPFSNYFQKPWIPMETT